jgi:small subunit ribosomal protein S17
VQLKPLQQHKAAIGGRGAVESKKMPKRQLVGVVKSDKMNKSRRVEIERLVQHKRYGKFMRRRTVCHVHDENNESHEGDTVEIIEAPPRSKLKRWDLLRIVSRSQQVDIAAMRAAAEMKQTETGEAQ